jgi:hypothetical protein
MALYKLKGTSGSVINQSFPLGDSFVLGSAADCEVRIDEADVAPRHAEITVVDGNALQIKDLGSASGTLLNGETVTQAMLNSGDEIHIGSCRWMLQAPGLRPQRILTEDIVTKTSPVWPRILLWGSVAVAAVAIAILKWKPVWIALLPLP